MTDFSVAMTEATDAVLRSHLLRADRQEDICLATYSISTGFRRTTHIVNEVHLPDEGERFVHGNASIAGKYVLRVAGLAKQRGMGVAILHSHPGGRGWQGLSIPDEDTEREHSRLATHVTGTPLVGLTLAGDTTWSARVWEASAPHWSQSVRVVGPKTSVSFNDALLPPARDRARQARTISAWGEAAHANITRLRVLVVGAGSVGLDIVQRLAATGIREIGVMDFDEVREVNLDRMVGATRRDAALNRSKVDVAARLARRSRTAPDFTVNRHELDVCTEEGLAVALDYDVVFSCVDRPLPRAVLNTIAYADLIPVIDGGIAIDTFDAGMRGASRRVQCATPGRPCLLCSGQVRATDVALDASGDLDDPEYIRRSGRSGMAGGANVALLAAGVSSSQLEHFVSLVAHPGGRGVPGSQRFVLAPHFLQNIDAATGTFCITEHEVAAGDKRQVVKASKPARSQRDSPRVARSRWITAVVDGTIEWIENRQR